MVAYITRDDSPEIPPPYEFTDVTILSFRLMAKLPNLQELCDQWLNVGTLAKRGFRYKAFLPFVDMEIVNYPRMAFAEQPYREWGYATQHELYFRFFVWRFQYACGLLLPAPLPELFFPYMFVDNSWSMLSGRNVIGFPKVLAQFSPTPVVPTAPLPITISALALPSHQPTTKLDWQPIVVVKAPSGAAVAARPRPPGGTWPWIGLEFTGAEARQVAVRGLEPALVGPLQTLWAAPPNTFSAVQLKQFRDAPSLTEACYQAVISIPFTPQLSGVPDPFGPATVTVNQYDSLKIPDAFGFDANKPLLPLLQYSVSLNMTMGQATNLFINS